MSHDHLPKLYRHLRETYPEYMAALDKVGELAQKQGPLPEKQVLLIQMAAAVAVRSEGSVHSHVRRALAAGATPEEIRHAILALTSTVGFPTMAAAMSWAEDVLGR